MILCDIGNTTFHFLIGKKHKKYSLKNKIPKFDKQVIFISVNKKASKKLLESNPSAINIKKYLNFKTKYKGHGLDRALACVYQKDAIIVDAGSAITVDIMKENRHEGGIILPGINNLNSLYKQISSKLDYEINTKVNLDKIPLCTQEAISYSILKSIILPIKELAIKEQIIFTGGDGEFLSRYFDNCIYKKDLIFENMRGIIDANNCIT